MKKKILIVLGSVLTISVCSALSAVVLQDDFSGGQGDWATRVQANGATATFANNSLSLTPSGNAQPVSVYHSFAPLTLEDGFTLRLTVDVFSANETAKPRDIRIGLGFADPLITGGSSTLAVPLAGYYATAPSGGDTTASRVFRTGFDGSDVNYFNTGGIVGDLTNTQSVQQVPATWVWEITRLSDDLVFGGSLNDVAFGSVVTVTGADVIDGFVFNTVGLAHVFAADQIVTFNDMKLEVIPEPATISVFLGLTALGMVLYRRRSRSS